jgi:pentatricopeptide repeat protein
MRPSTRSAGLLSCLVSDGSRKRLLSVNACTDRSHHPIMYYMMYDGLSLLMMEKRCRYMSLSTSMFKSNGSSFTTKTNSDKAPNAARRLQRAPMEAEKLMKKVIGTFQYPKDYDIARGWINAVVKDDSSSPSTINLSVQLFERVVREYFQLLSSDNKDVFINSKSSRDASLWFFNPITVSSLFNRWKEASVRNEDVLSPRDMIQKLQNMSVLLPEHFRYDIATMNILMHALILREPLDRAPFVAEKLLDFIAAEFSARVEHGDTSMRPTSYTYSMVLHAWSKSGLSNASVKMEHILNTVHKELCSSDTPNDAISLVSYKICLRYWSKFKKIEKVDAVMSLLDKNERLREKIDGALVSVVINAYAQSRQVHKVEALYGRMIGKFLPSTTTTSSISTTKKIDTNLVEGLMRSAFYLISFYRREIVDTFKRNRISESSKMLASQYAERAEAVLKQIEAFRETDPYAVGT